MKFGEKPVSVQLLASPIVEAKVIPYEIPLHTPFHISQSAKTAAQNVLVLLRDAEGKTGIGEGAPFPPLTIDDQQTTAKIAQEISAYYKNYSATNALNDLVTLKNAEWQNSPSARTAVEMALWDLKAKQLNAPLFEIWGHGKNRNLTTDITLPILPKNDVENFWNTFKSYNFQTIKIKIGKETVEDSIERIVTIAGLVGKNVTLFIDGNQGCSFESAKTIVEKLIKLGIKPAFFEQPLPEDDWKGLQKLSSEIPIPVCLDETIKSARDALRCVNEKTAQMINLKFMKSGITETLRIIEIARAGNIPLMIGGMVESEIAMTASMHAVTASGAISWIDLDTAFFLERHLTEQHPYHNKNAELETPNLPGIGLSIK